MSTIGTGPCMAAGLLRGRCPLPQQPVVVALPEPKAATKPARSTRKRKAGRDAGVIELEMDGVAMRVGRGADASTAAAVIRALKAPS